MKGSMYFTVYNFEKYSLVIRTKYNCVALVCKNTMKSLQYKHMSIKPSIIN